MLSQEFSFIPASVLDYSSYLIIIQEFSIYNLSHIMEKKQSPIYNVQYILVPLRRNYHGFYRSAGFYKTA
jgi:hypothetical protein